MSGEDMTGVQGTPSEGQGTPVAPGGQTLPMAGVAESAGDAGSAGTERRKKASRRVQILIASLTAGFLLLVAGGSWALWPRVEVGDAANVAMDGYEPWRTTRDLDDAVSTGFAWENDMNEALKAGDKELFLSHSAGQGRELLESWWDGTRAVGWNYAYTFSGNEALFLGMQLGFVSHPLRSSGSADAGLDLTQLFRYEMELEGQGDDAIIVGLVPDTPMPWDEGDVYVAKRDHVVLFGAADEQALIDANIDLAEESAQISLSTLQAIGGEAPTDGFNITITDDPVRFDAWSGLDGSDIEMHVAGTAAATARPEMLHHSMPASTATGYESSGSWIAMGPLSAPSRKATFVHEMAHVLHEAALPYDMFGFHDSAPTEGFAVYFTYAAGATPSPFEYRGGREQVLSRGEYAITNEELRGANSSVAYGAAGSFYQYVVETGGSPWALAMERDNGLTMEQRARKQGDQYSEAGWQAWAAAQ